MRYLVLCPSFRHQFDSQTPIKVGDKFRCYASCPMAKKCSHFAKGEFTVRSCGVLNNTSSPAKTVVKNGDYFVVQDNGAAPAVNPTPTPVNKPAETPKSGPVFSFRTQTSGNQATPNPTPSPSVAPTPQANTNPAPQPQPQPQSRPTFSFRKEEPKSTPVAPKEEVQPQVEQPAPQPQPKPFNPFGGNRTASTSSTTGQTGGSSSFSDRFNSRFRKGETESASLVGEMTVDRFRDVSVGGRIYSDNLFMGNNPMNRPLPLVRLFDEIRGHYLLDFVFENNNKLNDKFIWLLLKLHILPSKEKEEKIIALLKDRLHDNPQNDRLDKFFYLMQIITPSHLNNGFYVAEGYSYSRLAPLFVDEADYIHKFLAGGEVGESFRKLVQNHLFEVMYYLGYVDKWPTRENRDEYKIDLIKKHSSMFDQFTIRYFEKTGIIVYIDRDIDSIELNEIPSLESFLQAMLVPQNISKARKMVSFLEKFRFTKNGDLLPRDVANPLMKSEKPDFEGSAVYEGLGLKSSTLYLEEYNLYTILLREYIDTFKPETISINGVITLSNANFIHEVKEIVLKGAEASFANDDENRETYINNALLLYSLIERKIIQYYLSINQSKQLFNQLLEVLKSISESSLTVEEYLNVFKKDALFYIDGEHLTQKGYFLHVVKSYPLNVIIQKIKNDQIIKDYIDIDPTISKAVDIEIAKHEKVLNGIN